MATVTLPRSRTTLPPRTVRVRGIVHAVQELIQEPDIQRRVQDAAGFVDGLHRPHGTPVLVCVEYGSRPFFTDVCSLLKQSYIRGALRYASYRGTERGEGTWKKLPRNIAGRHIVLVEDIVDTGEAIKAMVAKCYELGAARVDVVTLLHKPANDQSGITLAWVGFTIEREFVIGYGLDYNGRYRKLRVICRVVHPGDPLSGPGVAAPILSSF